MGSNHHQLHFLIFPFMAYGHIIPMVDLAKLLASRGVKATIVTTPLNVPQVSKAIRRAKSSGAIIDVVEVNFPYAEVGLPEGIEDTNTLTSHENGQELVPRFFAAMDLFQEPLEEVMEELKPDCLVSDMFFPWTKDSASKFGIPRLMFHISSFFSSCVSQCLKRYAPLKDVPSDSEPFLVPNLPGNIFLTKEQVCEVDRTDLDDDYMAVMRRKMIESEDDCYGFLVNTFYELEPAYANHFKNVLGVKSWGIGPVSLCNKDSEEKSLKWSEASGECLKWLDSKEHNSVIYICFGSLANFPASQLNEIALALESSCQDFLWVVRKEKKIPDGCNEIEDWLPSGFEERTNGKGLIIRGWAPQVLILEHEAVAAFVTHCGWNSTLEGMIAGKPMVTWPVMAEQFYNEKFVTSVLRIGVPVGVKRNVHLVGDRIGKEAIEKALRRIMEAEEAEAMRGRAKALGELAKKSVQGGSSYEELNTLIQEIKDQRGK